MTGKLFAQAMGKFFAGIVLWRSCSFPCSWRGLC